MDRRFFVNPYEDYKGEEVKVNKEKILKLISKYVESILQNRKLGTEQPPDLYVGDAGNEL